MHWFLSLVLLTSFGNIGADEHPPKPPVLFGVDQRGYWENKEQLEALKPENPALYKKMSEKAAEVRKRAEDQKAREGAGFRGPKPDEPTQAAIEAGKARRSQRSNTHEVPVENPPEPALADPGVPKEVEFKGRPAGTAKRSTGLPKK